MNKGVCDVLIIKNLHEKENILKKIEVVSFFLSRKIEMSKILVVKKKIIKN